MSKWKASAKQNRRRKRNMVFLLCAALCLSLVGAIVAQWRPFAVAPKFGAQFILAPMPVPTPSISLSKEYIYAGSRLIATEEPAVLNPPSDLVVTVWCQAHLHWSDNSSNETSFKIERSLDGGNTFSVYTTVAANVTQALFLPRPGYNEAAYIYRVRASNASGDSAPSNTVSVYPLCLHCYCADGAPGSFDNSLALDGNNSYLEAQSAAGSSLDIRSSFTVEAWVKNSADTTPFNYRNILIRGDKWNLGTFSYTLRLADGKFRFDMGQADTSYVGRYSNTVMTTGVWHHVAGVYDGSQMRVYVDGVLDGSMAFTWTPPNISTIFRIGRETNIYYPFNYSGLIDEVRVSSGALYTGNFTPPTHLTTQSSTKGLWKFDAQSANDSSGNGNNGTLNGNGSYSTDVPTP